MKNFDTLVGVLSVQTFKDDGNPHHHPVAYRKKIEEAYAIAGYLASCAQNAVTKTPSAPFVAFCIEQAGGSPIKQLKDEDGYVVYVNLKEYDRKQQQNAYGQQHGAYGQPMAQPSPFGQYQPQSSINGPWEHPQQRQTPPQSWGQSTARPREPIPRWGTVPPWNEEAGPFASEEKMEEMLIVLYKRYQRTQENGSLTVTFDQYIRLSYPVLNTL